MKFFNIRALTKGKIAIIIIFTILINYLSIISYPIVDNFYEYKLQSPWTENILIFITTGSVMYSIYVFIITGLMYADTFVVDKKSGLKNIIVTKESWKKYVTKTLTYNFVIGGIVAIIPAFVNVLLWFCLRPNVPLVYFNTMNIFNSDFFGSVFMYNKFLFYILQFAKIFLIGGVLANFAMYLNTRFNNRYIGLVMGYIINNILQIVISLSGLAYFETSFYDLISCIYVPDYLSLIELLVFIVPTVVFFRRFSNKGDLL